MKKELTKNNENIISWLLVVIGAIVYISLIFNENVWLDEAFSASLVRTDMAGVLERSMADTLPPLYNIILKISTDIFGYSVPVMKLTSVVPMIITMIVSATVVRKSHGFKTSALFTIALFTMPNLLFFGVEIRMYSLGFMFATIAGIYSYEVINNYSIKNLIIFSLVSALAGYSHHFAFVSVGFVFLFMLIYYFVLDRANIKRWFYCLLITLTLYFPCLLVTLKQFKSVSGYFSMPDVTLSVFIKYMRYPYTVGNTPLSIALLISVFALVIYTAIKIYTDVKETKAKTPAVTDIIGSGSESINSCKLDYSAYMSDLYALSMFLVYYGVLVFGTIVSKLMTANIFVDRYLFFAHGMIWLFFAIEAGKFKKYYYVVVTLLVLSGVAGYVNEYHIEYDTNPDAIISYLNDNVQDGDVLYSYEDNEEMKFCLPFYDERLESYDELSDAIDAAKSSDATLYVSVIDYKKFDPSDIENQGFNIEFVDTFSFDRYTFDLYKAEQKKIID